MLASMSGTEAIDWMASAQLDPDEDDKADVRHALMMDLLTRLLYRGKKAPPTASNYLSSLPWREEYKPTRPRTQGELQAKINAVMRTLGGRDKVKTDGR